MTSYKSVQHLSKIKARKNSRGRSFREFLYLCYKYNVTGNAFAH